jgi:uncharacterized protein (TIGR02996 family)
VTERECFILAICEQPEEDSARLAFADWLDDHDEAGAAELIRRQIATGTTLSAWHEMSRSITVTVSRGFVSRIDLTLKDFTEHAAAIFSQHPVTEVKFSDREPLSFDGRWLWHNDAHPLLSMDSEGAARPSDHLPEFVFQSLMNFMPHPGFAGRSTAMVRSYRSEEAALKALVDAMPAAVQYGRKLAGLSPLASLAVKV